jgi:lysophospholipase L1-like esterase
LHAMTPLERKTRRRRVLRGAVLVGTLFGAVLLTNFAVCLMVDLPGPGHARRAGHPRSVMTVASAPDGFEFEHHYNQLGFRGADVKLEPPLQYRLACLGDSFTEGIGAKEGETWPEFLSAELATSKCEVLNLGIAGAESSRYGLTLLQTVVPLQATHVVVCFNTNDFFHGLQIPPDRSSRNRLPDPFRERKTLIGRVMVRTLPGWAYLLDRRKGRWPAGGGLYWTPLSKDVRDFSLERLVWRHSVSRRKAERLWAERLSQVDPAIVAAAREGRFNSWLLGAEIVSPYSTYSCRLEDMFAEPEDLRETAHAWMSWLASTCQENGIQACVAFFPGPPLVSKGPWGPLENPPKALTQRALGDSSISDLLRQSCKAASLPYVDLTPALEGPADELFWRYDTHPKAKGYALVAKFLAGRIRPLLR